MKPSCMQQMEVISSTCTKSFLLHVHFLMHSCLPMQPGSQKEMQIDFDDDESPQQTEQDSSMAQNVAKPRLQVYLIHALQSCHPCLNACLCSVTMSNHPAAPGVCSKHPVYTATLPSHQLSSLLQLNPFSAGIPDRCCSVAQGLSASQPKSAGPPLPVQSRKPAQVSSPPQPLSSRLGPQPAALRRPSQTPTYDQVRAGCTVAEIERPLVTSHSTVMMFLFSLCRPPLLRQQ